MFYVITTTRSVKISAWHRLLRWAAALMILVAALAPASASFAASPAVGLSDSAGTQIPDAVTSTFNPLDPALGFNAFICGAMTVAASHPEGPVAVQGNYNWGSGTSVANNYSVIPFNPDVDGYLAPGDTRPAGLVVGGTLNLANSTSVHQVLQNTYVKIGNLSGLTVHASGNTVVNGSSDPNTEPRLTLTINQSAASVGAASGIDFASACSSMTSYALAMSGLTDSATVVVRTGDVLGLNSPGQNLIMPMTANKINVLNVTGAQLNNIQNINWNNGQPTDTQPLIINVSDTASFTWTGAGFNGLSDDVARYLLFNFYQNTGIITIDGTYTVVGALYAPNAALIKNGGSNLAGQIVAKSMVHNGGELHPRAYLVSIPGGATRTGAIGNLVWVDENSDGYQDAGEPGLANVTVQLKHCTTGAVLATTVTDTDGGYLFSGLAAGTYCVDVLESTLPVGMTQTTITTNAGADFGNQNHSGNGYSVTIGGSGPWENLTADFGYNTNPTGDVNTPPSGAVAALGDRVWIDVDGDGLQDPEEVGVRGATVQLFTAGPDGVFGTGDDVAGATQVTNAVGVYLFDGLTPGAYVVKVVSSTGASHNVLGSGYTQTGDPDHFGTTGSNNDHQTTAPVVLGPGDVFLNADFGYRPNTGVTLGVIGDTVWFDANASGTATQDAGEYGIAGVSVALIRDVDGDGVWDAGEPVIAADVTDASGQYLFNGLSLSDSGDGNAADADYLVWVNDTDNVLGELRQTYDQDSPLDNRSATALSAGTSSDLNQDFSYTATSQTTTNGSNGLIGDTVWFDLNNSGGATQELGEPGIEGVVMQLLDSSSAVLATTATDENGHYSFGGLAVSTGGVQYRVRVAASNFAAGGVLQGMAETYAAGGTVGGNQGTLVTLTTASPINLAQDFSYTTTTTPGRIGNLVWLDSNADGVFTSVNGPDGLPGSDDDEPAMGGVTVDLYRDLDGDGKVDAGEPRVSTQTTASAINATNYGTDGVYLFTRLAAGGYVVNVTDAAGVLAGYWQSLGTTGINNNSQIDSYAVTLAAGADNLTADFGYYVEPAAVGNRVWYDPDNDGLQDSGELGIDGIRLQLTILYPNGVTTVLTTVTGNNPATPAVEVGWYSFGNLLLDEDYNASTAGVPATTGLPKFTITAPTGGGYVSTLLNQGSNDMIDADNPAGVVAMATQGLTQVDQNTSPAAESNPVASYDFGYYATPLAVTLASFEARAETNAIVVTWETVSEVDNAGFTLYRSAGVDGERVSLGFTPAAAPGSTQGASYSFVDSDVVAGQPYFYWLEALDVNGSTTLNGPVGVTMGAPTAVTLSGLQAASDPATPAWAVVLGMAILGLGLLAARQRRQA